MLLYLTVFVFSYLIGSLPTAYIVVKRRTQIDIRSAGSGNVGTLNAYEVTGSRFVGFLVLAIDVLKGAASVVLSRALWGPGATVTTIALVGVVVGHSFPLWLKFKGGRGLAPAAGAVLVAGWMFVVVWLLWWAFGYRVSKDIHAANIVAIVATPVVGYLAPRNIWEKYLIEGLPAVQFLLAFTLMSAVLLFRHAEPLRELMRSKRKGKG